MKVKIKSFNGKLPDYLTAEMEYEVEIDANELGGLIINDFGTTSYIRFVGSSHLNGGSWEIVD